MKKVLVVMCLLVTVACSVHAQEWRLRADKDGIQAYTRGVEGSSFDEYRVTMSIRSTKEAVLNVIRDHTIFEELYEGARDVRNIVNNDNLFINYARAKTPIVTKDREAMYQNTVRRSPDLIEIDIECITDHYEPQKRYIQITECSGKWKIEDMGDGMVRVTQQVFMNPGGSVPAWITNKYVVKNPMDTFRAIKSFVKKPKYQ